MTLLLDNRQEFIKEDLQAFLERVIKETLLYLKLDIPVEISLLLVNNDEIRQLNRDYRDKDLATDVLSFPMLELDPYDDKSSYQEFIDENIDPDTGEVLLGDIVISVERAIEQAKEYGHSTNRELGFLMVHGMLHLLGYDHEIDEEAETEMNELQEAILQKLELPRE